MPYFVDSNGCLLTSLPVAAARLTVLPTKFARCTLAAVLLTILKKCDSRCSLGYISKVCGPQTQMALPPQSCCQIGERCTSHCGVGNNLAPALQH